MGQITSLYAAILTLIYSILLLRVVQARWTQQVGLGHGESKHLQRRIRVHANFSENIPLTLFLLFLVEGQNILSPLFLNLLGCGLVIARLLHIMGLSQNSGTSFGRFNGTLINQAINVILALSLLYKFFLK